MSRPLLVLDVDGTLNPLTRREPAGVLPWSDYRDVDRSPHPLRLSRTLGDELARLDAERVWLTTWNDLANDLVAPAMGWPPMPVLVDAKKPRLEEVLGGSQIWKVRALGSYLLTHQPSALVWVDDLLGRPWTEVRTAVDDFVEQGWPGVPHLFVGPDPYLGISPDELGEMRDFLDGMPGF